MRNKAGRHMRRLCTTEGIVSRAGKVSRTEGSTLSALVVGRVYRYLCTRARIHSISFCARARLVDIPAIRGSRCGVLVPHRTPREGCFVARLHAEASLALHELAPTHCTNPPPRCLRGNIYVCDAACSYTLRCHIRASELRGSPAKVHIATMSQMQKIRHRKEKLLSHPGALVCKMGGGAYVAPEPRAGRAPRRCACEPLV